MTEPSPGRGAALPRHVRLMMRLSGGTCGTCPRPSARSASMRAWRCPPPTAPCSAPITTSRRWAARGPRCWSARRTAAASRGTTCSAACWPSRDFTSSSRAAGGPAGRAGSSSRSGRAADGLATVAWLREQDWFTGVLATIGPSYLSYVQWALAADPPPELRAMVSQAGIRPARVSVPAARSSWRTRSWPRPPAELRARDVARIRCGRRARPAPAAPRGRAAPADRRLPGGARVRRVGLISTSG